MKHYYRIADAWAQVIILALWLGFVIINSNMAGGFYFITGAWFFVSLIIHRIISTVKHKPVYNLLIIISTVFIGFFLLALAIPQFFIVLLMLLFIGPVMALLYTITCFAEIHNLRKRPISLLK